MAAMYVIMDSRLSAAKQGPVYTRSAHAQLMHCK